VRLLALWEKSCQFLTGTIGSQVLLAHSLVVLVSKTIQVHCSFLRAPAAGLDLDFVRLELLFLSLGEEERDLIAVVSNDHEAIARPGSQSRSLTRRCCRAVGEFDKSSRDKGLVIEVVKDLPHLAGGHVLVGEVLALGEVEEDVVLAHCGKGSLWTERRE